MPTNEEGQTQQQQDEEGLTKYAVECKCAHGQRPKDEEMTKLADDSLECPACGRRYAAGKSPDVS